MKFLELLLKNEVSDLDLSYFLILNKTSLTYLFLHFIYYFIFPLLISNSGSEIMFWVHDTDAVAISSYGKCVFFFF